MIETLLEQTARSIEGGVWLAPLLALAAGVLTSVTPCSLASVPLIVGYVGGTEERSTGKAFLYSVSFAFGSAVTFVVLGIVANSLGRLMGTASPGWYALLGVLMVLMALQTWGVIKVIPSVNLISRNRRRGCLGAFLAGILGGFFSSPCSTPVLIVLLALVAGKGTLLWGVSLMVLYSVGHSALVIVSGTFLGFAQRMNASEESKRMAFVSKALMGGLILAIGFYMFWLAF